MNKIIIPPDSSIYQTFQEIVTRRKLAFFAGLPGTGKSLLLKQCALMAMANGRTVHLLQWDVTRASFETEKYLKIYPEVDGVTHPALRKAVGLWARFGLQKWLEQFPGDRHLLIGEVPLIGNRLIELTQPIDDEIENTLAGEKTMFIIPAPTTAVRQHIEAARKQSMSNPKHEHETKDAPPNVLHGLWQQVAQLAIQLNLAQVENETNYNPEVYTAVYQYLLQHRQQQTLPVDKILQPDGSAYDLQINGTVLAATSAEVSTIMAKIEADYTPQSLATAVANWYQV